MERGVCDICVARACADAETRATQMTLMPSLKPLSLLCQIQGSLRHRRVVWLSQRKTYAPFPVELKNDYVLGFII